MANVRAIHNFGDQFNYQLEKLDESDIDERDREAIRDFARYQDTQRGLAPSTNIDSCSDPRRSAQRPVTTAVKIPR